MKTRDKFNEIMQRLLDKSGTLGKHDYFHGIRFYVADDTGSNTEKASGFAQLDICNIEVNFRNRETMLCAIERDVSLGELNLENFLNEVEKRIEDEYYEIDNEVIYSKETTVTTLKTYDDGLREGGILGEGVGYKTAMREILNQSSFSSNK
jgi:hypothetical protein